MAFDLTSIKRGKAIQAPRIFLYATHGIGKSTFASQAPNPIFIQTEDGLGNIDAARFPIAKSSADIVSAIESLYTEDHEFQTVVLDSADWCEAFLQKEMESQYSEKVLAYGKSAMILADKWKVIIDGLTALRNDKNMAVIILGHCEVKRFDNPDSDSYDRYQPKLQARCSALLQEWADCVLFAQYKTLVRKEDAGFKRTVAKATTTGERILHTVEEPAFLAKNRFSLPKELPLDWGTFAAALEQAQS